MTKPARERGRLAAGTALVAWLAFLSITLAALHAVGGGLAPPPVGDPGGLGVWLDQRPPAEAAFALLRLVTLGLAWYLLVVTLVGVLARVTRTPGLVRMADVVTIPAVRRIVNAAAGLSVAAATFGGAAGMAAAAADGRTAPPVEIMTLLPSNDEVPALPGVEPNGPGSFPAMTMLPATGEEGRSGRPTLRRLPEVDTVEPSPPTPAAPTPATPATPATPEATPAAPARWEVRPGQHVWAVAEQVLATAWRRPPSDAEIDPYWRRLVATNRKVLRDPNNPDLLYPGQILTVPPAPPPPPQGD